jgi:hypothetical protein
VAEAEGASAVEMWGKVTADLNLNPTRYIPSPGGALTREVEGGVPRDGLHLQARAGQRARGRRGGRR